MDRKGKRSAQINIDERGEEKKAEDEKSDPKQTRPPAPKERKNRNSRVASKFYSPAHSGLSSIANKVLSGLSGIESIGSAQINNPWPVLPFFLFLALLRFFPSSPISLPTKYNIERVKTRQEKTPHDTTKQDVQVRAALPFLYLLGIALLFIYLRFPSILFPTIKQI